MEIELPGCEAEYQLTGLEPDQLYRIVVEANGVHVARYLLADAAGVITLDAADYPAGWFGLYRFIGLTAFAGGSQLLYKKNDELFDLLILAMLPFEEHTTNETKIEGEWVYS